MRRAVRHKIDVNSAHARDHGRNRRTPPSRTPRVIAIATDTTSIRRGGLDDQDRRADSRPGGNAFHEDDVRAVKLSGYRGRWLVLISPPPISLSCVPPSLRRQLLYTPRSSRRAPTWRA